MSGWPLLALLALACFGATVWLTGLARTYAVRARMIDSVNPRGAHAVATPRGGGIAIVATTVVALGIAAAIGLAPVDPSIGLIGGGLIVAAVGWLDDHGHVRPILRLLAHAAGALWVMAWMGRLALDPLFGGGSFIPPAIESVVTLLFLMWMTNLYNFMDGIDGLAGSEAVMVATGGALLLLAATAPDAELAAAPLLLAAASLGFLIWNWPPARIFMGDVSSGFIGLAIGALVLGSARAVPAMPYAWMILAGVFIVDASVTLLRRLIRRERVFEAHRSHAYQHLARRLKSHRPVTLGAIALTVGWCFPLAWSVASGALPPLAGLLFAFGPLALGFVLAGAGSAEGKAPGPEQLRTETVANGDMR